MIERIDKYWILLGLTALMMIALPSWLLSREPENITNVQPLVITKVKPPDVVAINALTEKPIFNSERAPLAFADEMSAEAETSEEMDPTQSAQTAPAPTLVGLVSRKRGKAIAIVKNSEGQTQTLALGQSTDSWRLLSVGKADARFSSGGEQVSVSLDFSNKSIGGPPRRSETDGEVQQNSPNIGEPE